MAQAGAAMAMVGGAVTASTFLTDVALFGAQSVRYLAAALVLVVLSRRRPQWRLVRPIGAEWWWLIGGATAGLSIYNLAVVAALDHAEPTVVATVVSGVPLVLAIGAPIVVGRAVPLPLLVASCAVAAGAAMVQGGGRSDLAGIGLSLLALGGESAFTLLSLPVLGRLGAFSVATHTSWLAALQLGILAVVSDGADALPPLEVSVIAAIAYLVAASAFAFALWFLAVAEIGGDFAGLAAGIIPAAAIVTGLPFGVATLDAGAILGTAIVAGGLGAGLWSAGAARSARSLTSSSVDVIASPHAVPPPGS